MEIPKTGETVTWVVTVLDDAESFQSEMNESLERIQEYGATVLGITFTTSQESHLSWASCYCDEGMVDRLSRKDESVWVTLTRYNAFILVHYPEGADAAVANVLTKLVEDKS